MKRSLALLPMLAVLGGCPPQDQLRFEGEELYEYFPFNGQRTWIFESTDTSLTYRLRGVLLDESELLEDGRTRVFTVEFRKDCVSAGTDCVEDDLLFSWGLSADSSRGTLIHSYDGETFDTPVALTDAKMRINDVATSTSEGVSFSSTYTGQETCPAPYWRATKPDCIRLDVVGEGSPLEGSYWATYTVGIVAFQLGGSEHSWQMRDWLFET